jgi:hypothetical protein
VGTLRKAKLLTGGGSGGGGRQVHTDTNGNALALRFKNLKKRNKVSSISTFASQTTCCYAEYMRPNMSDDS